ncbi:hypothetical protein BDR07DRAFT_1296735, partial [Suillus spraguei]
YHSKSGYLFGQGQNILQEMEDHDSDQKRRRTINSSYPFVDQAEWQLAKFLVQQLTQTDINRFLKLDWCRFKSRHSPSFKSADQLFGWIDALPSGPEWQSMTLEFTNYTTEWPIKLIWRDGLEVIKDLFANPIFSNHMMYDPHIVMTGSECEYGEFSLLTGLSLFRYDSLFIVRWNRSVLSKRIIFQKVHHGTDYPCI